MKWELVCNPKSSLLEYRLTDENGCRIVVKYHPLQQSARISCGVSQRLFFMEKSGSLNGKVLFKNEYGLEIGSLQHDKWHSSEGYVTIDSKKYHYKIHEGQSGGDLMIFHSETGQPLLNCSLKPAKISGINLATVAQPSENVCLLLGICWYLFLPVAKENLAVEFAA